MTDEVVIDKKGEGGTGADQKGDQTKTETTVTTFDPSKVSDEEFGKVFDDPRTFQHSRFKELTDAKRELTDLKKKQADAENAKLAEDGKFKELAEAKERELATLREQAKTSTANLDILAAASKLGAVDPKVVLKLIDRATVVVADDGTVTGAEEAVKKLLEASPYLKGTGKVGDIGAGAKGEGDEGKITRFKHSQLLDPAFYKKHEAEIMTAMAKGQIENDL